MMNYSVTIDVEIFEALVRQSEKIAVLKRYNDAGMYISSADLFCILGFVHNKESKEDETNENS